MTDWTPARVEKLKALWASGLPASEIAPQLGVTRSGVLGKVYRLRLPPREPRKSGMTKPKAKRGTRKDGGLSQRLARARGKSRGFFHNTRKDPADKLPPALPIREPEPLLPPLMTPLMDLTAGQCRWPFGDPKESTFGFCGHPRQEPFSYCVHHSRLAYQPADDRRRSSPAEDEARAA